MGSSTRFYDASTRFVSVRKRKKLKLLKLKKPSKGMLHFTCTMDDCLGGVRDYGIIPCTNINQIRTTVLCMKEMNIIFFEII